VLLAVIALPKGLTGIGWPGRLRLRGAERDAAPKAATEMRSHV
jgi:hypothetical protein